jgi:hypothetical protein
VPLSAPGPLKEGTIEWKFIFARSVGYTSVRRRNMEDRTAGTNGRQSAQARHLTPKMRLLTDRTCHTHDESSFWRPVGIWIFAFTTYRHVHWIWPIIGSIPFGAGTVWTFNSVFSYLVDAYRPAPAANVHRTKELKLKQLAETCIRIGDDTLVLPFDTSARDLVSVHRGQ